MDNNAYIVHSMMRILLCHLQLNQLNLQPGSIAPKWIPNNQFQMLQ